MYFHKCLFQLKRQSFRPSSMRESPMFFCDRLDEIGWKTMTLRSTRPLRFTVLQRCEKHAWDKERCLSRSVAWPKIRELSGAATQIGEKRPNKSVVSDLLSILIADQEKIGWSSNLLCLGCFVLKIYDFISWFSSFMLFPSTRDKLEPRKRLAPSVRPSVLPSLA